MANRYFFPFWLLSLLYLAFVQCVVRTRLKCLFATFSPLPQADSRHKDVPGNNRYSSVASEKGGKQQITYARSHLFPSVGKKNNVERELGKIETNLSRKTRDAISRFLFPVFVPSRRCVSHEFIKFFSRFRTWHFRIKRRRRGGDGKGCKDATEV